MTTDFHVFVGVVVDGEAGSFEGYLAVFALEEDRGIGVFEDSAVVFDPGLSVSCQGYTQGAEADVFGELEGLHYFLFFRALV